MAITLTPAINTLGITAPVLGPWFSNNAVTIGPLVAAKNLAVTVNFPAATNWWAAATGTLSLFVTDSANPPAAIANLQDSSGAWPFPSNRLVAVFRLLPEIEARIQELSGLIPSANASPLGATLPTNLAAPSRPQVRSFAFLLPDPGPNFVPADIYQYFGGVAGLSDGADTDAKRMAKVGLGLNTSGNLVNGPLPMTWLRRPGGALADRDLLLQGLNGNLDFWAFDRRGRALDPGAVACWWSWLLNTGVGDDPATGAADLQLLAPAIAAANYPQQSGLPVVVPFAAGQTVHLVDPHEGPLGAPFINGRLQNGGTAVTANLITVTGNGPSFSFAAVPAATSTPPADNPTLDNAPRPRMAILPLGTYGTTATVWPGGPLHTGLSRDFVRLGVVDEEFHLTGITRRDSRLAVTSANERRQSAQNRPSTQIRVNRTNATTGVLLPNSRATADALLNVPNINAPTRMVLGIADTAWGGTPTPAAPAVGPGPLPVRITDAGTSTPAVGQYRVQALIGGGALAASAQSVLVEVNLGPANAGAWLRAWPLGFNASKGERVRLRGGSGRADTNGLVHLTMQLANGLVASQGLLGMDIVVTLIPIPPLALTLRHYADCRFSRPAPLPGAAATVVSGTWVICESGVSGNTPLPAGSVPPGGQVVLLGSPPSVLDRTAIPAASWDANTLINSIQAGTDIVSLTAPAFDATPDRADAIGRPLARIPNTPGNPAGGLNTLIGNRLHVLNRSALAGATASSVPYTLLNRLEVAAASNPAGGYQAVIGSAEPTPWALSPSANFFLGFPEVPAGIETHGTGVSLTGAPAQSVLEYLRERTAGLGFGFVQTLADPLRSAAIQSELAVAAEAAVTPLPVPADGAGAGPVVAILRTCALGMEGIPGVAEATMANANLFPFSQNELALEAWLNSQISAAGGAGNALRAAAGTQIDSMTRALDRRLLTSAFGAKEGLISLLAAIDRAQDFIYLETPGVDELAITGGGENMRLWQRLVDRMNSRKGLQVLLCVPAKLGLGTPQKLQDVRDHCLLDAITTMRNTHANRFAVLCPGVGAGRPLRISSTSVIVDDAYCLTGTTHLTRRGLSWDSSLAAAVFDQRLSDGRPTDVVNFRLQLLADRLGLPITRVPTDPAELVQAVRALDLRGSNKLATTPITRPATTPASGDIDIWNPDGSQSGLSLTSITTLFASALALTDTAHAVLDE